MNHELLPMVNKKRKFSHLTSVITMQKLFSSVPQKCLQNLQYFIPPHKILNTDKKLQSHCCLTKVHFNVSEISKAEYPGCRRQTAATSQFLAMVPSKFSHYFFFPLIEACASFPIPRHRARMWPESRLQKGFVHFQFCQVPSFNHFFQYSGSNHPLTDTSFFPLWYQTLKAFYFYNSDSEPTTNHTHFLLEWILFLHM